MTTTHWRLQIIDKSSFHLTLYKATTIRTLTQRAQLVCNTTDSLSHEKKYLNCIFSKNNDNDDFIWWNTHHPMASQSANMNWTLCTQLTTTFHLTLKTTSTQVIGTSVTTYDTIPSQNHSHMGHQTTQSSYSQVHAILCPRGDWHITSLYNIYTLSGKCVKKILKLIR